MADTSPRLGITFAPTMPPEQLRPLAETADAAGLDDLWVWEDCFKESGVASAAAALAWTERIRVGIGLMPTPLRNVALTAMEIATLDRMFPRRLVPGVGHGVQSWMGQVGGRVGSPMTLLSEYASALHALLAGQNVTVDGRYIKLTDVRLDWPPLEPPALMFGGQGAKSLRLAAREGVGTLLALPLTDDQVRAACELVADERASLEPAVRARPHEVVATLIAATGPDARARLDAEFAAWGVPGADPADGIGVAGGAEEIASAVRRTADLGATTVVLLTTRDEPDLTGFVEFVGSRVRPLLDS